jgi:hypothetical protein
MSAEWAPFPPRLSGGRKVFGGYEEISMRSPCGRESVCGGAASAPRHRIRSHHGYRQETFRTCTAKPSSATYSPSEASS